MVHYIRLENKKSQNNIQSVGGKDGYRLRVGIFLSLAAFAVLSLYVSSRSIFSSAVVTRFQHQLTTVPYQTQNLTQYTNDVNRSGPVSSNGRYITESHEESPSGGHSKSPTKSDSTNLSGIQGKANAEGKQGTQTAGKGRAGDEVTQVVFAKVHKAASSTVQNVLLRFAMARDLDVMLPRAQDHVNEFGSKIDRSLLIEHRSGQSFDILANHLVFNEDEIAAYIPRTAFRFGILREPLSQALSALQYYTTNFLGPGSDLYNAVHKYAKDPVKGFLDNPQAFCNESPGSPVYACMINNRMSLDLGFGFSNMAVAKKDKSKIQAFVEKVDTQFDVMLISEYFDESMVLLRRHLHWQMKDIIYIRVNVADKKSEYVWRRDIKPNPTQMQTFKQWAAVDIALYDHFLTKFLKNIETEHLFQEELSAFKAVRSEVVNFCKNLSNSTVDVLNIAKNRWSEQFSVSRSHCQLMMMTEKEIVDMARASQRTRFHTSLHLS
ncbi:hypothetical protein EGW08_013185 [Elysia chlorotica]|uniref:Uncharacterized protein n=1 Tax=Elysia chlorotica TaxID=188477 RepID=A0A3S1B3K0_ELYCH|nr:hypothetical protein EGW08_013185 [Elysia chlorotica]